MGIGFDMKIPIRLRLPKQQVKFLKENSKGSLSKTLNQILSNKDVTKKLKSKDLEFQFVGVAIEKEIVEKIKSLAEKNETSVTHVIQALLEIAMESDDEKDL